MALAFRAAGVVEGSDVASVDVPAPAGLTAGDVMVAFITNRGGSIVAPSGWTLLGYVESFNGSTYSITYAYSRVAVLADAGGTWTWSNSGSLHSWWAGSIVAYSGGSPTTPTVGEASYANNSTGTAITGTPVTTPVANTLTLVAWAAAYPTAGTTPAITPAAGTSRVNHAADTVRQRVTEDSSAPGGARSATVDVSSVTNAITVVIAPRYWETPATPTLVAPANGAVADIAAGYTFDWGFNDTDSGDTQSAYALKRKSGGGADEWWTGSVWTAVETWITTATTQVPFAASKWTSGVTYQWAVATKDSLGTPSSYSSYFTITAQAPPAIIVNAPTDPVTTTTRPTVGWVNSSGGQSTYQVRVFTAAQYGAGGFDPATSTSTADSTEVTDPTARSWALTSDLVDGTTYRAYVRTSQSTVYATWQYIQFTLNVNPPSAPTLVATADPTHARVALVATTTHDSVAFPTTAADFQYLGSDGAWHDIRGASAVAFPTSAVTYPATVGSSTFVSATAAPNQKKLARLSNGDLVAAYASTGTNAKFGHSSDNGVTWTDYGADIVGWSYGSIDAYVDTGGIERITAVWEQSGTGGSRTTGDVYLAVGTLNTARTTLTWGTPTLVNADPNFGPYPDIVAHPESTGGLAHIALSYIGGNAVYHYLGVIDATGAISSVTYKNQFGAGSSPSIAVDRATKTLAVAWSDTSAGSGHGLRWKKCAYAAGAFNWGTEREIDNAHYVNAANSWLRCLFDGTRWVIVGNVYDGANYDLVAHDRDAADTTTTTRTLLNDEATNVRLDFGSAAYDTSGNLIIIGVNQDEAAGAKDLVSRVWTRLSNTLGAEVVLDANVADANAVVVPAATGAEADVLYMTGTGSPYSVKYAQAPKVSAPAVTATAYDYESTPSVARSYRAKTVATI